MARHGPDVHPGRHLRRYPGHGSLSPGRRLLLLGDQPVRRYPLPDHRSPAADGPGHGKRLWALTERLSLSPSAVLAGLVTLILVFAGLLAPWIAPHDPFDLASLRLTDAFTPPVWSDQGN